MPSADIVHTWVLNPIRPAVTSDENYINMPEQKSSSNAYLFVDGYKDPNDLIGGCGDKNSEARRHVQKSRRLRHFRAHKPAMLRNCRVRVEVSDRFCNSTLQSSRSDRKPVRSTDERSPEVTPVPRPASMDSFITFPAKNVSTIVHQIIDHGEYTCVCLAFNAWQAGAVNHVHMRLRPLRNSRDEPTLIHS